ncbi:excitatory amino acid transporter 3 isoform X2 [Nilaparvata lugens]|uniref:excitatory amino acid transporter 3 isoform X2 n=1 Tax=Nilaparvata lugens TaxID=108931 RepID=UPI00193DB0F9|nr:excitatory amino acid transporter 3 isoform X2 [Nilaparvata lugens]
MAKTKEKRSFFMRNLLTILTVVGVFSGVIVGLILRATSSTKWKPREIMYVNFLGDMFLQMLKGLIIPLLLASIVSAIGSLDLSLSRKIGARAIAYYMTTTVVAVVEGIILVSIIEPGRGSKAETGMTPITGRNVTTADTLLDLIRNMFPPNIVKACVSQYRTVITAPKVNYTDNLYEWDISGEYTDGSNILGVVVFGVVLGIAIGQLGPIGLPLLKVFQSLGDVTMLMTTWVIWLSPGGVFFLVASKILEMKSFVEMMEKLGLYFATVLFGLFVHGFVVLPAVFTVVTKTLPFRFLGNMSQALITAFGTASSSASLPVSMSCLEDLNNVDPRVSRFVMPIGATINMDGTALYEAVAALFIAQLRSVPLTFGNIVAVSITATMASIGAAGIPQAGLVTMVMVLDTVGLPAQDVTLIIAVDWLLDRFRTTISIFYAIFSL